MTSTFLLKGTAGGAGNGYWTADSFNSNSTITLASGVNFSFERRRGEKKVKLTLTGTLTAASSAAGRFSYNCIIPGASIPRWARPALPSASANVYQSVLASVDYSLTAGTTVSLSELGGFTMSGDSSNLLLAFKANNLGVVAATASTLSVVIEYPTRY